MSPSCDSCELRAREGLLGRTQCPGHTLAGESSAFIQRPGIFPRRAHGRLLRRVCCYFNTHTKFPKDKMQGRRFHRTNVASTGQQESEGLAPELSCQQYSKLKGNQVQPSPPQPESKEERKLKGIKLQRVASGNTEHRADRCRDPGYKPGQRQCLPDIRSGAGRARPCREALRRNRQQASLQRAGGLLVLPEPGGRLLGVSA